MATASVGGGLLVGALVVAFSLVVGGALLFVVLTGSDEEVEGTGDHPSGNLFAFALNASGASGNATFMRAIWLVVGLAFLGVGTLLLLLWAAYVALELLA